MNKLRLIKIYELKGKIHPIEAYIIDLLEQTEVLCLEHRKYFKISNISYFDYNGIYKDVWIYSNVFDLFFYEFKCLYEETKALMKYLLEKHLKLEINVVR